MILQEGKMLLPILLEAEASSIFYATEGVWNAVFQQAMPQAEV